MNIGFLFIFDSWQFHYINGKNILISMLLLLQQNMSSSASANDRKKKNAFTFSRRFPFMKSKDQSGSEDVSADERKFQEPFINPSCLPLYDTTTLSSSLTHFQCCCSVVFFLHENNKFSLVVI